MRESQRLAEGRLTPRQRKYMRGGREESSNSFGRSPSSRVSGSDFYRGGAYQSPTPSSEQGGNSRSSYGNFQDVTGGREERPRISGRYGAAKSSNSSTRKIEVPNRALRRASIYGHYENPPPDFKVPLHRKIEGDGDPALPRRSRDSPLSLRSSFSDDSSPRTSYRPLGDSSSRSVDGIVRDSSKYTERDASFYNVANLMSRDYAARPTGQDPSYRKEREEFGNFENSSTHQFSREPPQFTMGGSSAGSGREPIEPEEDRRRPEWKVRAPLSIPYTTPASEFLYGTSVITAALKSGRRKMYKLYLYNGENRENVAQDTVMRKLALSQGVEVTRVQGDWLRMMDKMSGGRPHNGYILEASPLPKLPVVAFEPIPKPQAPFYISLDHQSREEEAINGSQPRIQYKTGFSRYPFVLLLDGILDPGNLGAIMRTAYYLGIDAVAISNRNSAPFTPVTLKASAGASEDLPLMSISQPGSFIDECQKNGWKFYAAVAPGSNSSSTVPTQRPYYSTSEIGCPTRNHPCVLILGGEGEGLRWNIQRKADYLVGIEGHRAGQGGVDSLNVSVAAGLLCEAFMRKPARHISDVFKSRRDTGAREPSSVTVRPIAETSTSATAEERNSNSDGSHDRRPVSTDSSETSLDNPLSRYDGGGNDAVSEHRLF